MARRWVATSWGTPENWALEEYTPAQPGPGEITIRVRAAGVNPADAKHVASERPPTGSGTRFDWPVPIGYEISGEVTAVGPGETEFAVGDEVIAFRVSGGYATALTVPREKVLRKPSTLTHPEAANLLLAGTTAAEMIDVVGIEAGETMLLHGASGAVGVSVLQQAAARGIRVIGTASPERFDVVSRFGGIPVAYGPGLGDRVRHVLTESGAGRLSAALDAIGTDEAIETSLALVPDRACIVTIVASARAQRDGFVAIAGSLPASARFRDEVRPELVRLAEAGVLTVPLARTFPLDEAPAALALLATGHPGGKLALIP